MHGRFPKIEKGRKTLASHSEAQRPLTHESTAHRRCKNTSSKTNQIQTRRSGPPTRSPRSCRHESQNLTCFTLPNDVDNKSLIVQFTVHYLRARKCRLVAPIASGSIPRRQSSKPSDNLGSYVSANPWKRTRSDLHDCWYVSDIG